MSTTYKLTVYSEKDNSLIFDDLDQSQLSRLRRAYDPQFEANYWVTGISVDMSYESWDTTPSLKTSTGETRCQSITTHTP